MKLTYMAYCYPCENKKGAYTVEVPGLPGCVSEGSNLVEAIEMATDAASGWILDELEDGNPVPPSDISDSFATNSNCIPTVLVLDIDSYAEKYGSKAVRKNLTIPAWLNTFAEKKGINFSNVLQDALTSIYKQQYIEADATKPLKTESQPPSFSSSVLLHIPETMCSIETKDFSNSTGKKIIQFDSYNKENVNYA